MPSNPIKPTTYPFPTESFHLPEEVFRPDRRDPGQQDLTIEQRIDRLEAWTREEIFARTAMDEPDPVTVLEDRVEDLENKIARLAKVAERFTAVAPAKGDGHD